MLTIPKSLLGSVVPCIPGEDATNVLGLTNEHSFELRDDVHIPSVPTVFRLPEAGGYMLLERTAGCWTEKSTQIIAKVIPAVSEDGINLVWIEDTEHDQMYILLEETFWNSFNVMVELIDADADAYTRYLIDWRDERHDETKEDIQEELKQLMHTREIMLNAPELHIDNLHELQDLIFTRLEKFLS